MIRTTTSLIPTSAVAATAVCEVLLQQGLIWEVTADLITQVGTSISPVEGQRDIADISTAASSAATHIIDMVRNGALVEDGPLEEIENSRRVTLIQGVIIGVFLAARDKVSEEMAPVDLAQLRRPANPGSMRPQLEEDIAQNSAEESDTDETATDQTSRRRW